MTPEELKALFDEQKKLITEFQAKSRLEMDGRITKAEMAEYSAKVDSRLAEINTAIGRLQAPQNEQPKTDSIPAHKMFWTAFRKTLQGKPLEPSEQKTMTIADPTTGGYVAPLEFVNEVIKLDVLYSPIRSLAKVRGTSNPGILVPKKTSSASASWVAEIGSRTETTNPKLGMEEIRTHEMYALAKISKQDLEDAQFDLEGFLRDEFAEQFGVAEGTAFVSGSGTGKPEGLLTNAAVVANDYDGPTTSGKILADDLKAVLYGLPERYAANATWIWKRSSTLAISILKNATTGDYLWQPGLQAGTPANVLGRPYVECVDMPSEANSAKAVLLGDFKAGYLIVDRISMEILVDPYTSKSTGLIEISARKRVGGQVVLSEAFKLYTLKA